MLQCFRRFGRCLVLKKYIRLYLECKHQTGFFGVKRREQAVNKPIDISSIILNTERLVLRPWKKSDRISSRMQALTVLDRWQDGRPIKVSRNLVKDGIGSSQNKKTFYIIHITKDKFQD